MKKILSLLLAVVMVIGMLPAGAIFASAAETSVEMPIIANQGTMGTKEISWTSGAVTFKNRQASSSTAIRTSDSDHFRIYASSAADIICTGGNITKIVLTATSSSYATVLKDSVGAEATVSGSTVTITLATPAASYTIAKMTAQTRINKVVVTYATVDSGECAHTNTETIEAKDPTCTEAGNTAGEKCTDCGEILSGNEVIEAKGHSNDEGVVTNPTCTTDGYTLYTCTVCGSTKKDNYVDATGHNYVDGTCSVCGTAKPAGLDGKYYIAAIRSSGNYQYMTNDLGTASTKRYQIVDSGLTDLPASIETVVDSQVFELIVSGEGYIIKTGDQYLGWTSGNSGALVAEADARVVTIENGSAEGSYNIHFAAAADDERYLALNSNSTAPYFAWYKGAGNQIQNLYLVPVSETAEVCEHTNTTVEGKVDATCTTEGYTGDTVCSDCGETVTKGTTIDALGHSYTDGVCGTCGVAEPTTSNAQWILVTDASVLTAGDQIVIVASGYDYALSTTQQTNNRTGVAITKDGNVVEIDDSVQILTLEAGTVDGTWAFNTGSGYLYAASSSANHLKTQTTNNANGSFKIEIASSGVATIKAQGTYTRNWMRFNSSNSPKLFACYSSGQADISIYKYTTVDGCVHEVAEDAWTIVSNATCETAGSKTGTCSKCGETVEKEIPALGHNYSYNAETGMMICANCGDSFMNTIAEAKAFTDANKIYYLKGIVTYVSGQTVYMQDATGGICVYFTDAENAANIAVGDELLVMDTLTSYKGLIETSYTKSTEVKVLSNGNELPVQTVTIADLLADTTNEYLGERVQIVGATIGMVNSAGDTALTVGEDTINLYKAAGLASNVTENDTVTVTAIVGCYDQYQLLVNPGTAATDVVVTTEGVPSDIELSEIATAKAGTVGAFFKIKGIVTFVDGATVYMQDETAGIALYLASGVTAPAIGDEIEAIGAYDTYNGLLQLEGATFETISSGNTVAAKEVALADLVAAANNEYLSEKVSLKNLTVTKVGSYSASYKNIDYTVTDGTNEFKLFRAPLADEANKLAVGTMINVIGVVGTYNGYQLRVANEADIQLACADHEYDSATGACVHCGTLGELVAVYEGAEQVAAYATIAEAIDACEEDQYIKLLHDVTANNVMLYADVYIDLNGFDLTGSFDNADAEAVIYGMDSTTNSYTCENNGIFNVVDHTGEVMVPVSNWKTDAAVTGSIMRYMTVAEEAGYSFHRFYVGVTKMSLKPTAEALGYKAVFAGSDKVKDALSGFGLRVWVDGYKDNAIEINLDQADFVSGKEWSLRVQGITEGFFETDVCAEAFVILNGETVTSSSVGHSLRYMLETVNNNIDSYTAAQKTALAALVEKYYSVMKDWNVDKIYAPVVDAPVEEADPVA